MYQDQPELLDLACRGHGDPVTPTILGRLHGIRAVGTASLKVLVSPPLPGSAGRAVDCCSSLSKTPSGTGVQVEAIVNRSAATAFFTRGMWCRCRTSKSFSSLRTWSRCAANGGSLQQHSPLTCLMMSWESPFTCSCQTPRDRGVFSPKIRASYSIMLLVTLNSRCTIYLNCFPTGVRSRAPTPPPCLHEEPSK
jgi:hypothetical protein